MYKSTLKAWRTCLDKDWEPICGEFERVCLELCLMTCDCCCSLLFGGLFINLLMAKIKYYTQGSHQYTVLFPPAI